MRFNAIVSHGNSYVPKLAVSFKELHKSLKSELRNRCPPWRKTLQLQGGNSCFLNSFLGGAGSCRKSSDSYFATSIALAGGIRATGSTAFINFFDPCAFFCLCHTVVVVAAHVVVTEVAIVGAVVTVVVVGGGGPHGVCGAVGTVQCQLCAGVGDVLPGDMEW